MIAVVHTRKRALLPIHFLFARDPLETSVVGYLFDLAFKSNDVQRVGARVQRIGVIYIDRNSSTLLGFLYGFEMNLTQVGLCMTDG